MKTGDKVRITYYGALKGKIGEILCCLGNPKSNLVVVEIKEGVNFVGGGSTSTVVINREHLETVTDYLDHVVFTYLKDNEVEQRNVLVTNETREYIEGHDLERDGFRRFLKSKILGGKIFRAGKPQ